MSMHDDQLWDGNGAQDATIAALESLLRPLAHDGRELPLDQMPAQRAPQGFPQRRWLRWPVAAAALLGVVFAIGWLLRDRGLYTGAPARTFVAGKQALDVPLDQFATITLQPGSELRFEHWRQDQVLFHLERGGLSVRVLPPPAVAPDFFLMDTALGRCTDKGCRYTLRIADDGSNLVSVTEGAVTFAHAGRTVFVPAGATTTITAKGPRTPLFVDCNRKVREVTGLYDDALQRGSRDLRFKAVVQLRAVAHEARDSLVLWHTLADADPDVRNSAEQTLLQLVGPPDNGTTKAASWDQATWLTFLRQGPWSQAR